jgi:hypothetical protein
MSIVSPQIIKTASFLAVFLSILLFVTNPCLAWDGYDYQNDGAIEIGSGNLIREGEIINFYDAKKDQMHSAEVTLVQNGFTGSRVEVYDINDKKKRTFEMQD